MEPPIESTISDFNLEALAAWEEYQKTGLHLTGDEVDAWFDAMESDPDAKPPECHI